MKSVTILIFLLFSHSLLAKADFILATHTKPPLSNKIEALYRITFQRMGYSIDFSTLPGRRVVALVNNGIIDGDATRIKSFTEISSDETNNYILVDEPVITIELAMIVKKSFNIAPTNWEAVNQGTAAYISGSMNIEKNIDDENRVPVLEVNSALEMVKRGRVQSAILFKAIAKDVFNKKKEYQEHLKIIEVPLERFYLYLFLNKKHTNLQVEFIRNLQEIKKDGTYDAIFTERE